MPENDRIRVLHVVRPATGGMKEQVLALATGCASLGVVAEIACPAESDLAREACALGLVTHPVPIVGPVRPLRDLSCAFSVARIVRRGGYHVVHAHGFKAGAVGRLGAVLGGCPVRVATVHNFAVDYRMPAPLRAAYLSVERLLAPFTARVIAVSEALRRESVSRFGIPAGKVVTIRNGIDTSRYDGPVDREAVRRSLGVAEIAPLVGTAARFAPQKGLRHLVEAMPEILRLVPGARLAIGGDGPLRAELEGLAVSLGVADEVVLPGFVRDMPAFLGALDVYACPSLSEGLSIGVIEAMTAGVPVVASDAGGIPELLALGDVGVLVPPGDVASIAEQTARLLEDPARRERLGENGARVARQRLTRDRMVRETCDLYRELVRGGRER